MRTIQTEPLTHETFAPFGNFYVMTKPDGYKFIQATFWMEP